MPARARNLATTIALTCVMAVLLCLVQTASAVAAKSPEKTASGIFFTDPNIYTWEIAAEFQQPQWEIDPAATPTASGRQDWLSADPVGEEGGLNMYAYVGGNPLNYIDPFGLREFSIYGGAGAGGYLSFGVTNGRFNFDVGFGKGAGLVANLKFMEDQSSDCDDPLKNVSQDSVRFQALATGGARLGPLAVGGEAKASAEVGYDDVTGRGAWKFQGQVSGDVGLSGSPMSASGRHTETFGTGMPIVCGENKFNGLNIGLGAGAFAGGTVGVSIPTSRRIPRILTFP